MSSYVPPRIAVQRQGKVLSPYWNEFTQAISDSRLVRVTEEYTSKTCTKCGHVHRKLGGAKTFKCPNCHYEIPRDFNGALGIFLKALWDTTILSDLSDEDAIFGLSKHVGDCPN